MTRKFSPNSCQQTGRTKAIGQTSTNCHPYIGRISQNMRWAFLHYAKTLGGNDGYGAKLRHLLLVKSAANHKKCDEKFCQNRAKAWTGRWWLWCKLPQPFVSLNRSKISQTALKIIMVLCNFRQNHAKTLHEIAIYVNKNESKRCLLLGGMDAPNSAEI